MNTRGRAIATLVGIFLLGCLTGAGVTYSRLGKSVAAADRGRGHEQSRQKLEKSLELTPEQQVRFKEIMAESRRKFEATRAETAPKFQEIKNEMRVNILGILNDEQKQKFEAYLKEQDAARKKHWAK